MQKRGSTNIEFILAFVLFAGFIGAALYLFNPIRATGIPESTINYIVNEIAGDASVGVDSYSVAINPSAGSKEIIAVEIEGIEPGRKTRVEDYYGEQLGANRAGDIVYLNRTDSGFIVIKFCEDFSEKSVPEQPAVNENYYKIASSGSEAMISEKRMLLLNETYHLHYTELKKELGIPSNVEFSFTLTMKNGFKIIGEKGIPVRAEVFTNNLLKEIVRSDGTSEFGELTISIW